MNTNLTEIIGFGSIHENISDLPPPPSRSKVKKGIRSKSDELDLNPTSQSEAQTTGVFHLPFPYMMTYMALD